LKKRRNKNKIKTKKGTVVRSFARARNLLLTLTCGPPAHSLLFPQLFSLARRNTSRHRCSSSRQSLCLPASPSPPGQRRALPARRAPAPPGRSRPAQLRRARNRRRDPSCEARPRSRPTEQPNRPAPAAAGHAMGQEAEPPDAPTRRHPTGTDVAPFVLHRE
jgi:hypothetical protein